MPLGEVKTENVSRHIPFIETRYSVYLERSSEARSCTHCCSGKVMNITYWEFSFVT
jgi:hypothetical protein